MLIQGFTYMLIFRLFVLITWLVYTAATSGNERSSLPFTLIQLQAGKIFCFLQKALNALLTPHHLILIARCLQQHN